MKIEQERTFWQYCKNNSAFIVAMSVAAGLGTTACFTGPPFATWFFGVTFVFGITCSLVDFKKNG